MSFTAFRSRKKSERVTGRLVLRRIPEPNPKNLDAPTLFDTWQHHAFFTTAPAEVKEVGVAPADVRLSSTFVFMVGIRPLAADHVKSVQRDAPSAVELQNLYSPGVADPRVAGP